MTLTRILSFLLLSLLPCAHASELTDKISKLAAQTELAIVGQDDWLFLKQEMTHLAKGPLTAESVVSAVQAMSVYHTALAAEGVQLVVVPVPAKGEIYPDKLVAGAAPQEMSGRQAEFIKALQAAKVDVVDLAAAFHAQRERDPKTLLYCQRDAHWSPAGLRLAATIIQGKIKDQTWLKPAVPLAAPEVLEITGDLMTTPTTQALGPERLTLQRTPKILPPAAEAAAILLGDSHTLVFGGGAGAGFHCQGGGLLDVLQASTGQAWMQIANAGGGSDAARIQLARKAIQKPDFWKAKRLVVWCFSIREVTEKQWAEVPIKR